MKNENENEKQCSLCRRPAEPKNSWHPDWCEECEERWFDEWMEQQDRVTNKSAL